MRASAVVVTLAVCLLASEARAEAGAGPRNAVTTNPARFAVLHFQLEYERVVDARWSAFVAPIVFHHAHWYPFAPSDHATSNGWGFDAGARWFWRANAPAGGFVGPHVSGYRASVEVDGVETLKGYVWSPGFQAGYTYLIDRWLLSAGAGMSYGIATDEGPDGTPKAEQLPHRGPWLNVRLNAGLRF